MSSHGHNQMRTLKAERIRIIWLWLIGMPARIISLYTGISIRTVSRWIRRWQEEGHVETRSSQSRSIFSQNNFYTIHDTLLALYTEKHSLFLQLPEQFLLPYFFLTDELHKYSILTSYSASQRTTRDRPKASVSMISDARKKKCDRLLYHQLTVWHQHIPQYVKQG